MKAIVMVLTLSAAAGLGVATASAQGVNLSGPYECVQGCVAPPPAIAYVTQNGWDLNLVNEAGMASRAWIDWPGHIWARAYHEGAVYSPDGMSIQFDHGSVWRRVIALPPPPPPPRIRYRRRPR